MARVDSNDPAIAATADVVLRGDLDESFADLHQLANCQAGFGQAHELGGAPAHRAKLGDLGSVDALYGEAENIGVRDNRERCNDPVLIEGDEGNGVRKRVERSEAVRLVAGSLVPAGAVI